MIVESHPIELGIHEWSRVLLALCGGRVIDTTSRGHILGIAKRIANHLAEAIGIDPPGFQS